MAITIEDFEEDFKQNLSEKHQKYIIDFCNTFQVTFPDVMDKKDIINRISWLKDISEKKLHR